MKIKTLGASALGAILLSARGDQVVMQNGDHYTGHVLSLTTNAIVLQNDNLGKVTLPRAKVTTVTIGSEASPAIVPPRATQPATTSADSDLLAPLHQLATQTNLIQQVQGQYLGAASPEANAKFNQMVNDLSTGKMNLGDLRAQAKDVADQLRQLEKESGEDASGTMGAYLSVLDSFVKESTAADKPSTNSASALLKPKPTVTK